MFKITLLVPATRKLLILKDFSCVNTASHISVFSIDSFIFLSDVVSLEFVIISSESIRLTTQELPSQPESAYVIFKQAPSIVKLVIVGSTFTLLYKFSLIITFSSQGW